MTRLRTSLVLAALCLIPPGLPDVGFGALMEQVCSLVDQLKASPTDVTGLGLGLVHSCHYGGMTAAPGGPGPWLKVVPEPRRPLC